MVAWWRISDFRGEGGSSSDTWSTYLTLLYLLALLSCTTTATKSTATPALFPFCSHFTTTTTNYYHYHQLLTSHYRLNPSLSSHFKLNSESPHPAYIPSTTTTTTNHHFLPPPPLFHTPSRPITPISIPIPIPLIPLPTFVVSSLLSSTTAKPPTLTPKPAPELYSESRWLSPPPTSLSRSTKRFRDRIYTKSNTQPT